MASRLAARRDRPRAGLHQRRTVAAPDRADPSPPRGWPGGRAALKETVHSLNKLLDLDLAIIEDAYQAEYVGAAPAERAAGDARPGRRRGRPRDCATRST